MSNVHRIKDADAIRQEAGEWIWRLDDEDAGDETRREFRLWLNSDPRHREAYDHLSKVWTGLDGLRVLKNDVRLASIRRGVREEEWRSRFRVPLPAVRVAAIAASLLLIATAAVITAGRYSAEPDVQLIATAVGQQRSATLADGSVVDLNTNTIVEVDFGSRERVVRLEKGEAHFEVAKNAARPFLVVAGDTTVRAVGTAFNVHRLPDAPVKVIVTEGKVEVAMANQAPQDRVLLEAGQALQAEGVSSQVAAVAPKTIEKQLAWRQGMLIFESETLENVVEELSRYTEVRFVIVDDAIRERPVGGYFRTDDIDGLLSVLESGLDVEVQRQDDSLVFLSDAS